MGIPHKISFFVSKFFSMPYIEFKAYWHTDIPGYLVTILFTLSSLPATVLLWSVQVRGYITIPNNTSKLQKRSEQTGAEMGQAQLKLGLDFNLSSQLNLH